MHDLAFLNIKLHFQIDCSVAKTIRDLHTSGVNVVRMHVLLANEMHVLHYYASISDQSRFARIASQLKCFCAKLDYVAHEVKYVAQ